MGGNVVLHVKVSKENEANSPNLLLPGSVMKRYCDMKM